MNRMTDGAALLAVAVLALAVVAAGCGSGAHEPPTTIEFARYHRYLMTNTASLVRDAQAMQPELEHNAVLRAQSRYARARVRYSQIEPAAEMFPDLNAAVDARPDQASAKGWTGFHRIERALFNEGAARTVAPLGRKLIEDAKALERKLSSVEPTAAQLAAGAGRILTQISTVTLANKEEAYSDVDLVDVSANLEAVGAAFEALKPALTPEERIAVEARLGKAYAAIGEYGTPARDPDQPRARSPGSSSSSSRICPRRRSTICGKESTSWAQPSLQYGNAWEKPGRPPTAAELNPFRMRGGAAAFAAVGLMTVLLAGCGSGSGDGEPSPVEPANVKPGRFRAYVETGGALMAKALKTMLAEIKTGDVTGAQSAYAAARVRYSQIEPAAEMLGDLNSRIDGLESEAPPGDFGGFHRIEKALFLEKTAAGMIPVATRLLHDTESLELRLQRARFSAQELADGALRILAQASGPVLESLEEPYSQLTLVDISGNVESVGAALDALQPVMVDDAELSKELSAQI